MKVLGNQKEIVSDAINYLRNCLKIEVVLKQLFPDYVTLKELQTLYEELFSKKVDRRNFRKKMLLSGMIEKTDKQDRNTIGRPATFYVIK